MRTLPTFLFSCWLFVGFSQTGQIDSIKKRLRYETAQDTLRAFDLNELSWQFVDYSTDSAAKYAGKALALSRKINYLNGIIDARNVQGIVFRLSNRPDEAIRIYEENILLRKKQGRYDKLTGAYSNLGSVYFEIGDNVKALEFYRNAYANAVKYNQKDNQLVLLNNLGVAYKMTGLYDLAIESFRKGLVLNKDFNDDYQEGQLYMNIATVYDQRELFRESDTYYRHSYAIFKRLGNIRQLSSAVYNLTISSRRIRNYKAAAAYLKEMEQLAAILEEDQYWSLLSQSKANFYNDVKRYDEAMTEIDHALKLCDSTTHLYEYGILLLIKADCYSYLKQFRQALDYAGQGLHIMEQLERKSEISNCFMTHYEIYKGLGDFKQALSYYEEARKLREAIATDEFDTKIATLNSLNELDKKDKQLQLSHKEKEKVETENRKQAVQLIASLVIGLLVLILLVFSARAYRLKKKANELLHTQKLEIEFQKHLVDDKQKEILDSIHYARRIQSTLLANRALIDRHLPENFILFKPKDIVSGDFYWATETNGRFYLAVCDSTGHGVPGAFMSLLNSSFLREAITDKNISGPHEILNHVRTKLVETIAHDGAQDGMDGIVVCVDRAQGTITYAASHNRPVIVRNGALTEFPADKMPVGKSDHHASFSLFTLEMQPGDLLFLYTDGYADQFGGPKGKKFKYRQLEELLTENAQLPLPEQLAALESRFESWRGELEQVDDVTVVGIKF